MFVINTICYKYNKRPMILNFSIMVSAFIDYLIAGRIVITRKIYTIHLFSLIINIIQDIIDWR